MHSAIFQVVDKDNPTDYEVISDTHFVVESMIDNGVIDCADSDDSWLDCIKSRLKDLGIEVKDNEFTIKYDNIEKISKMVFGDIIDEIKNLNYDFLNLKEQLDLIEKIKTSADQLYNGCSFKVIESNEYSNFNYWLYLTIKQIYGNKEDKTFQIVGVLDYHR